MTKPRKPTIRDVAKVAGVSTATVSKFMNAQQSFSEPVEAKIREAIEQLGYQQNYMARAVVTGKTGAIGLGVLDICNPHYTNVVKGANRVALEQNYSLLVVDLDENQKQIQQRLQTLTMRVDGLLVSGRLSDEVIDWLAELRIPVVFIGHPFRTGVISVGMDVRLTIDILANYLIGQQFKRIAYVGYAGANWNAVRIAELQAIFSEHDVEFIEYSVEAPTVESAERIASKVLLSNNRADAIIACNDQVAIGLMGQARQFGVRIPQDIAIAGIDNNPISKHVNPSLTTIDTRGQELGEMAIHKVLDLIDGKDVIQREDLDPELVIRESTKVISS
ncbi:Ribose operon repressor [Vibrio quintilis]|uniref:Ribose operon repressor n=2 Tax=Vibrio quintilis TaxID=1117707 RepID=A0A1M7YPW4_9VIBR|nr:Ribose operon repressor [Vibrio quintilis]